MAWISEKELKGPLQVNPKNMFRLTIPDDFEEYAERIMERFRNSSSCRSRLKTLGNFETGYLVKERR